MPDKSILICDDEEGVRESYKLILENKYSLVFAENGIQCIEQLKANPDVSLIMLDIKMPRLNGIEVLKEIKKIRPNLKVILATGYRSVEAAAEASRYGADDYIIKPFDKQEMLQTLAKALN